MCLCACVRVCVRGYNEFQDTLTDEGYTVPSPAQVLIQQESLESPRNLQTCRCEKRRDEMGGTQEGVWRSLCQGRERETPDLTNVARDRGRGGWRSL